MSEKQSRRRFLGASAGAVAGAAGLSAGAFLSPAAAMAAQSSGSLPRLPKNTKFVWVAITIGNPFYVDGTRGMKAFGEVFGVETEIVGPQDANVAAMTATFQATVADPSTSGIFSYYTGAFNAAKPLYEQAQSKGIPIVNGASDWGPPRISYCGQPTSAPPTIGAAYINKVLKGSGTVGFIGNNGSNLIAQEAIFAQLLKTQYTGLKYAGNVLYGGTIPEAISQVQAFIGANPGLSLLYWADGSGNAVSNELVQIGGKLKWLIGGFGAPGVAALKKYPQVVGLIDRDPYDEEFYGFQPLFWWKAGYRVPDTILVSTFVINKANVKAFSKNPYRRVLGGDDTGV